MNEEVKTIRNNIVRKFCRTVLWIDDEIHLDLGFAAKKTPPLFQNKFDEFTRSGLLCHMMGFPATINDSDPYSPQSKVDEVLSSCILLALQSDIVIIDWMLGTTDSSEYAQKIVTGIVGQDKGFRFIVVLSKKTPEDSEFTKIDSSFKCVDANALWKNESGQFLLSLRKDEFNDANLFERLCSALLDAYPDYLHLTALEIAGRIKELAPQWLSALPSNTDMGILTERANLMLTCGAEETWQDDIRECVVANLLEDLTTIVLDKPLNALEEKVLRPSNAVSAHSSKLSENSAPTDVRGVLVHAKQCLEDKPKCKLTANQFKQLSAHRDVLPISNFVEEIEAYTEFCEMKSICDSSVCPGMVYSNLFTGSQDIAVCISAACDCIRADSLLFLRGECLGSVNGAIDIPNYDQLGKEPGGKTVLRFHGRAYIFRHKANFLTSRLRTDLVPPIKPIGTFRSDVLNRLVSRFMSRLRRVGVNQPSLSRSLRKEGLSDEE